MLTFDAFEHTCDTQDSWGQTELGAERTFLSYLDQVVPGSLKGKGAQCYGRFKEKNHKGFRIESPPRWGCRTTWILRWSKLYRAGQDHMGQARIGPVCLRSRPKHWFLYLRASSSQLPLALWNFFIKASFFWQTGALFLFAFICVKKSQPYTIKSYLMHCIGAEFYKNSW